MTTRTAFAVLAAATTMDIALISTKRVGESLEVEPQPKRLRNDDQERCDAIDTIGSAIISDAGLADDDVFRAVTVTGREPEISAVTKVVSDALEQHKPASTQALPLTHEQKMNYERVLREVMVAFTRVCGGAYLSRSYWENIAKPSPVHLMQHLLSDQNRAHFVQFADGDESKLRDMISLYDQHTSLIRRFSQDIHTATVGEAIEAVDAWLRHNQPGALKLKKMLQFELGGVWAFRLVSEDDRRKPLHDHVRSINERRVNSAHIESLARTFNEAAKQRWIQDAEAAKLLVTYDKYEETVTELSAKDAELAASIQALTTRNTELETELNTVRSELETKNTALASELASTKDAVQSLTKKNAELETKNAELETKNTALASELASTKDAVHSLTKKNAELEAKNTALASELASTKDAVQDLTNTVGILAQQVAKLLAGDKSSV
ncbi:hypothetical protein FN846DRAFT_1024913 [Sphaerosporella brunnea]|uniref:Uncharacterized protein n=1 Tax=Sphaerosporella brunnea TaxID=1250544 RepID=A0A5J5EIG3_9PEZI|nr:hypothetical protein FN846DRAFT_1024913 [Sphaerosporella brunnea]